MTVPTVQTCLWFAEDAEAAARFYVGLLPGSRIVRTYPQRGDPQGRALIVQIDLMGQRYSLLNGGRHYTLTPRRGRSRCIWTRKQRWTAFGMRCLTVAPPCAAAG